MRGVSGEKKQISVNEKEIEGEKEKKNEEKNFQLLQILQIHTIQN